MMELYLKLEALMVKHNYDCAILDILDLVWYRLTDEEHDELNARGKFDGQSFTPTD
jgi:hypothetical protein